MQLKVVREKAIGRVAGAKSQFSKIDLLIIID
jgi:hypothetical protein